MCHTDIWRTTVPGRGNRSAKALRWSIFGQGKARGQCGWSRVCACIWGRECLRVVDAIGEIRVVKGLVSPYLE